MTFESLKSASLTNPVSMVNNLTYTYMDILDLQRVNALIPFLEHHGLQDVIHHIINGLIEIRKEQQFQNKYFKYKIHNWRIVFDNSFDCVSLNSRLTFIKNLEDPVCLFSTTIKYKINELLKKDNNDFINPNILYLRKMRLSGWEMSFIISLGHNHDIGRHSVDWTLVL